MQPGPWQPLGEWGTLALHTQLRERKMRLRKDAIVHQNPRGGQKRTADVRKTIPMSSSVSRVDVKDRPDTSLKMSGALIEM